VKLKPASVGTFDQSSSTQPQPGSDRATATTVAEAGFGAPSGAARPSREPGGVVIGSTGFEPKTDSGTKRSTEPRQVQAASFEAVSQPTQTSKPAPPQPRASVPVEIVFKPTPTYTPEARSLKVEGEVSLEVEFCASGQVRILRVVRGLGHGLDEAAARAAERIQFRPARSGSTPIDYRAIVHITFRLT
jgi:TonB family protein